MRTKLISFAIALLTGMSAWADDVQNYNVYEDCSQNGQTIDIRPSGQENGYEWVNLGLPSGLKWASCNVGAEKPEDKGNYYAWGEVTPNDDYSWATYKYANGDYNKLTKYCNNTSYGDNNFTDDKTTLDLEDDAAHYNWGGNWRMPTSAEIDELLNNCTWEWTTQNEVNGYKVTSKANGNGNSIFLPAAGVRDGADTYDVGSYGYYWSSSLYEVYPDYAWYLLFGSNYHYRDHSGRYRGFSVRPVCSSTSTTSYVTLTLSADGCESTNVIRCNAGQQVQVTAVPQANGKFSQWSDGITENPRTITVDKDTTLTAIFATTPTEIWKFDVYEDCTKNGYETSPAPASVEAVDLGLSIKWASCNVGATNPEDLGNYYAWGEVLPKDDYSWATYKYANGSSSTLTKYCNNANYGDNSFTDDKTTLDLEDDAAHVNWGGNWRMPTSAEIDELLNNCTWEWTTQNKVNGYKVTSDNGNSIFLPAAGLLLDMSTDFVGSYGYYWSSSLGEDVDYPHAAQFLNFFSDQRFRFPNIRYSGQSVRPVCSSTSTANYVTLTLSADGCGSTNVIRCNVGQQVQVTAVANENGKFSQWSDGITENPRTVTVNEDMTLTAKFATTPTEIQLVEMPEIRTENGRIICDGDFQIFDLLGRNVTRQNGNLNGVYIVKCSDKTQKVVVR